MSEKDQYKAEGDRRMKLRKAKRNAKYISLAREAHIRGIPIYGVKGHPWEDENSPTGYSQVCSWRGTCQHPCNGDC